MLRQLYQKGSLRNTEEGFEMVLVNTLAPGTVIGLGPIQVDQRVFTPEQIIVAAGRSERLADRISERGPVSFPVNGQIRLRVIGAFLAPGQHTVVINAHLKEIGPFHIEVEDQLAG
ncbi:MAG: hydroxymethylglutaryl-CoA reductase [Anaerolineae bacterium]|nr:hydroxymethylglutaryl-CoA reductase [Anaerolineae bacterium]